MPLTKDYYRYQLDGIFNLSVSASCNVLVTILPNSSNNSAQASASGTGAGRKNRQQDGIECVVFGFAEYACVWDVRKNAVISRLKAANSELRQIAVDSKNEFLACGYADGTVAAFQLRTEELLFASKSHKTAVSALAFTEEGSMLASGSLDCQIMFWDLITRTGICRVKGHSGSITQLKFVRLSTTQTFLVSSSRDTTLKIWDLSSYRCCSTITGHVSDVNSFVFIPDEVGCMLVTTSNDAELRVFRLESKNDAEILNNYAENQIPTTKILKSEILFKNSENDDDIYSPVSWSYSGSILRQQNSSNAEKSSDRKAKKSGASLLTLSPPLPGTDSFVMVLLNNVNQQVEQYTVLCGKELDKRVRKVQKKRAEINQNFADEDLGAKKRRNVESFSPLTTSELVEIRIRPGPKVQFNYDAPNFLCRPKNSDFADEFDDKKSSIIKKISNLCFTSSKKSPQLLIVHHNSFYFAPLNAKTLEISAPNNEAIDASRNRSLPGHESDVRCVTFSRDGQLIASGSAQSLRIWNIDSLQQPLAVAATPSGLVSCAFLHDSNRYVLVGTKDGQLLTFDIRSSRFIDLLENAHESGPIWSICMVINSTTDFYTAGEDKQIRLWRANFSTKHADLTFPYESRKTYTVEDAVTDLKMSPNGKFIAFALLDNTVRIHFADSFKFFLSLYGHSLPVLTLDISSDSKLIVTGSADKNVKIWGMDFGDCHKSLFAHDERVTSVRFVPNSHLFFSAGRDGKVKQWDADKFLRVATLPDGHFSECWCLAVYAAPQQQQSYDTADADGNPSDFSPVTVVSAGHDKTIRLWTQSEELLVLDEEERLEREKEQFADVHENAEEPLVVGEQQRDELGVVEPRSIDTMDAADRLVDAIGIYETEKISRAENGKNSLPQNAVLRAMGNISAEKYFLDCLRQIRPHNVQTALLSLPSDCVAKAAKILLSLLSDDKSKPSLALEAAAERKKVAKVTLNDCDLILRSLVSLMRLNAMQIVASGRTRRGAEGTDEGAAAVLSVEDLESIQARALSVTRAYRDLVASNTAALRSARQQLEVKNDEENVFADAMDLYKQKEQRKKRKQRAALTVAIQQKIIILF